MNFFQKIFPFSLPERQTGVLMLGGGKTYVKRGSLEMLQAFSTSPTLAGVVSAIANDVAANQYSVWSGKRQVENHDALTLLRKPIAGLTGTQKLWLIQIWLDLIGEAPLVKLRDGRKIINLYPLPPTWIKERAIKPGEVYKVSPPNSVHDDIPFEDIIWFHRPDPSNPYQRGSGLGRTLSDEVEISELSSGTIKRWFVNGGKPDVLIVGEGLTKQDTESFEQKWAERHGGFFKRYLPAFMGGVGVQVHQLSTNFNDLQLSELRQDERRVIQQTYGVPSEILGDALNSNRATITAASTIYAERVLTPRLALMCEVINLSLMAEQWPGYELRYENPVKEDRDFKLTVYQAAPHAFSVDEWRKLAGDPEIPNGKGHVYMVSPMLMPVSSPAEEIEAIAPAPVKMLITKQYNMKPVNEALKKHPMKTVLLPQIAEILQHYGEQTVDEFSPAQKADREFEIASQRVIDFLRDKAGDRIRKIEETTHRQIAAVLLQAERETWTLEEVASAVEGVMDDGDRIRAWSIARTETVHAANAGNFEGGHQLGIERKEWIATMDGRERTEHALMDEQIVDYDKPFRGPNGESGMYPGDFPEAHMSVNCRCIMVPVPGEKSAYNTVEKRQAKFNTHDRQRMAFEVRMRRSVRKVFAEQKRAVIAAIRG